MCSVQPAKSFSILLSGKKNKREKRLFSLDIVKVSLAGLGTSFNQNSFFCCLFGFVSFSFFCCVFLGGSPQGPAKSGHQLWLSEPEQGGLGPMSTEQVKCSCGNVSSKAAPSIKLNKRGSAATSGRIRARG